MPNEQIIINGNWMDFFMTSNFDRDVQSQNMKMVFDKLAPPNAMNTNIKKHFHISALDAYCLCNIFKLSVPVPHISQWMKHFAFCCILKYVKVLVQTRKFCIFGLKLLMYWGWSYKLKMILKIETHPRKHNIWHIK